MKNVILTICVFALLPSALCAQMVHVETMRSTVQCVASEYNNKLVISDFKASSTVRDMAITEVHASEGNVVLSLRLAELVPREYYKLAFQVSVGNRTYQIRPESLSKRVIYWNEQQVNEEIIWYNAFEEVPLFGPFDLQVDVSFFGQGCLDPTEPEFRFKAQLPYLAAGAAGLALMGVSEFILVPKVEEEYDRYTGQIFGPNDPSVPIEDRVALPPEDQDHDSGPKGLHEAEDHYNDVKNKNETANLVRRTGQVIVAGSAILYIIRRLKYKRDHKYWDRYCNKSPAIGLQPMYDTTVPGQSVGLALTVRF